MKLAVVPLLALLVAAASCKGESAKPKTASQKTGPVTFDSALISNLTPVLDGGAYATGLLDAGVWYLRGTEAARVREVGAPGPPPNTQSVPGGQKDPSGLGEAFLIDIIPSLDGGAYAKSLTGGVWFLRGTEAIRVKEVPALSGSLSMTSVTGHEKRIFVLAQYQASKLARCEGEKTAKE